MAYWKSIVKIIRLIFGFVLRNLIFVKVRNLIKVYSLVSQIDHWKQTNNNELTHKLHTQRRIEQVCREDEDYIACTRLKKDQAIDTDNKQLSN